MSTGIIILFEILLLAAALLGFAHEDRLIAFERKIAEFWREKRVRHAARIVEAAGYACWPKRRG